MRLIFRVLRLIQVVIALLLLVSAMFLWFSRTPETVTAQGEVQIEKYQAVRPTVSGFASNIMVQPGDFVHANQPLLYLDDYQRGLDILALKHELEEKEAALAGAGQRRSLLEQEIHRTELARQTTDIQKSQIETQRNGARVAELEHACDALKDKYGRLLELVKDGLVSQMEVEDAHYSLLRAQAQLRQSQLEEQESMVNRESSEESLQLLKNQHKQSLMSINAEEETLRIQTSTLRSRLDNLQKLLDKQKVCAPADGIVVGLNINELMGRRVEAGEIIFTVIDDKAIEFVAQVSEESIVKMQAGQEVLVEIGGLPKLQFEVFHGRVRLVEQKPLVNRNDGHVAYPVHIALDKPWVLNDGRPFFLQNGMSGKAKIIYRPNVQLIRAIKDALLGWSPY